MTIASFVPVTATRILIVDDHPLVRHGLRQIIQTEPDLVVCGDASGATEALTVAEQTQPDLVIVDLSLSEGNGLDLIDQLRRRFPRVRIIVSSVHDEAVYAEPVLRAGASAYVNKQASISVMIEAIRQVRRGAIYASPAVTERLLQSACSDRSLASRPLEKLSSRELQVFELLGEGLTVVQVAARLSLSPKTVSTYCDGLKLKLNLENAVELRYHAVQWRLRQS